MAQRFLTDFAAPLRPSSWPHGSPPSVEATAATAGNANSLTVGNVTVHNALLGWDDLRSVHVSTAVTMDGRSHTDSTCVPGSDALLEDCDGDETDTAFGVL